KSLSIDDICLSAANRGGADISAAAMGHAVQLWLKEMAYRLCDGFSINAGWFNVQANIRGVFNSPSETFSPEKHTVSFEFHQGSLLRKELGSVEVEIQGVAEQSFYVAQVTDIKSGLVNDLLTPNRNLRIQVSKLKIAGESENNGIFFVNQANQQRVKVDATDIVNNNPSELIIVIPALEAGSYKLEIVTQFTNSSKMMLKEPRTTVFDRILAVV
ncbi:MAG: DUF4469 domain-containing protein, partial [Treponema sp.]|nr:DUF4469 domain-containing protein [Treponema sp.]